MKRLLPIILAVLATAAASMAQEEPLFYITIEATSDSTATIQIPVYATVPSQLEFVLPDKNLYKVIAGETIKFPVQVNDVTRGGVVTIDLITKRNGLEFNPEQYGIRYDTQTKQVIWATQAGQPDSVIMTIVANGQYGGDAVTRPVTLVVRLPYSTPGITVSKNRVDLAPGESVEITINIDPRDAPMGALNSDVTWGNLPEGYNVQKVKVSDTEYRITITRESAPGQSFNIEFTGSPVGMTGFFGRTQGRGQ